MDYVRKEIDVVEKRAREKRREGNENEIDGKQNKGIKG